MKVEYVHSYIGGDIDLIISGAEFVKADDDEKMYTEMEFAINAYNTGYGLNITLSPQNYIELKNRIQKNGKVIVSYRQECTPYGRVTDAWSNIYVMNGNNLELVLGDE
ncbi:hypothetical protein [Butyrivibrio sp.]|uniref:hypothetical protein n=1 Tax=Butyrivibrio sp. TaxID=28121 RepID=UPI0025BF7EFE|nr:hypothetical protein [Butyrivibrio sp.]MBQ9304499.1 hypothetical protein [Butyrivibrio sp.]